MYFQGIFRFAICFSFLILTPTLSFAVQDAPTSGELSEATMRRFLSVLERSPRRGTALDRVYDYHLDVGTLDTFLKELTARAEKDSDNGTAWLIIALINAKSGKHTQAIEAYQKAEAARESDALVPYYLAQSYLVSDQQKLAIEALQRSVSRKPPRTEVLEIYKTLGRLLQRTQRTEEAIAVWKELESLFPEDPRVPEQIAAILVSEGDFQGALERYEKLIKIHKDEFRRLSTNLEVAQLKFKLNRRDEAIEDLEQVLAKLNPDSWLYREARRRIEESFLSSNDLAGIIQYYEVWIAKHPEDLDCMLRLSSQLKQSGRLDDAIQWIEKAVQRAPSRKDLRIAYVDVLIAQNKVAEANKQYEELAKHNPVDTDLLQAWGNLVLRQNDLEPDAKNAEARRIWMKIVEAKPKDAVTVSRVADLMRGVDLVEPALELYRRAIELAPNDPQYREYLGEYLHGQQRKDEALEIWAGLAAGEQKNAANLMRLAEVYKTFGYLEHALSTIRQAIEMAPRDLTLHLNGADYALASAAYDQADEYLQRATELAETDEERTAVTDKQILLLRENGKLTSVTQELSDRLTQTASTNPYDWIRLARFREEQKRWPDALNALRSAIELKPDLTLALSITARIAETAGDYARSIEMYRSLATQDRKHRGVYLVKIAQLQQQLGFRVEALATGNEYVEVSSGSSESYLYFARLCNTLGLPEEQLATLRKALRVHPSNTEIRTELAHVLEERFQTEDASELYWLNFDKAKSLDEKLIAIGPLASLMIRTERTEQLIERLRQSFKAENQQRDLAFCIAEVHALNEDAEAAKKTLEPLLDNRRDASDTVLLETLVRFCQQCYDTEGALRYQQRLVSITNTIEAKERLATLYGWAGESEKEQELILSLAKQVPNPSQIMQRIDQLLDAKAFDIAESLLDEWFAQKPDDWELLYRQAYLKSRLGKNEDAQLACKKLLALPLPLMTMASKGRGEILKGMGFSERLVNEEFGQKPLQLIFSPIHLLTRTNMYMFDPDTRVSYAPQAVSVPMPNSYAVARVATLLMLDKLQSQETSQEEGKAASMESFLSEQVAEAPGKPLPLYDQFGFYYAKRKYEKLPSIARALLALNEPDAAELFVGVTVLDYQTNVVKLSSLYVEAEHISQAMLAIEESSRAKLLELQQKRISPLNFSNISVNSLEANTKSVLYQGVSVTDAMCVRLLKEQKDFEGASKLFDQQLSLATDALSLVELMRSMNIFENHEEVLVCYDRWLDLFSQNVLADDASNAQIKAWKDRYQPFVAVTSYVSTLGALGETHKFDDLLERSVALLNLKLPDVPTTQITNSGTTRTLASYALQEENLRYGMENVSIRNVLPLAVSATQRSQLRCALQLFVIAERQGKLVELFESLDQEVAKSIHPERLKKYLAFLRWQLGEKSEAFKLLFELDSKRDPQQSLNLAKLAIQFKGYELALKVLATIQTDSPNLAIQKEWLQLEAADAIGDVTKAKASALYLSGRRLTNEERMRLINSLNRYQMTDVADRLRELSLARSKSDAASMQKLMESFDQSGNPEVAKQIAEQIVLNTGKIAGNNARDYANRSAHTAALQYLTRRNSLQPLKERIEKLFLANPTSRRLQQQLLNLSSTSTPASRTSINSQFLERMQEIVKESPNDAMLRIQLTKALDQSGQADAAVEHLIWLLQNRPDLFASYNTLLTKYFYQNHPREDLTKALVNIDINRLTDLSAFMSAAMNWVKPTNSVQFEPLIERLLTKLPRGYMEQWFESERLNPDVYHRLVQGMLIPDLDSVNYDSWHGLSQNSLISSRGPNAPLDFTIVKKLNSLHKAGQLDSVSNQIKECIAKYPNWRAGPVLLILVQRIKGNHEECQRLLSEWIVQPSLRQKMTSANEVMVAQELCNFPDLKKHAIDLLEPNTSITRLGESSLEAVKLLNRAYLESGEFDKSIQLMRRVIKVSERSATYYPMSEAYYQIFADQLRDTELHAEQMVLLRQILNLFSTDAPTIDMSGESPTLLTKTRENFDKTLAKLKDPRAFLQALQLLEDPATQIVPQRNLDFFFTQRLLANKFETASIESDLWSILAEHLKNPQHAQDILKAAEKLVEKYPEDVAVASLLTLVGLSIDQEGARQTDRLKHLVSCCDKQLKEVRADFQLEFDFTKPSNNELVVWLVARQCLHRTGLAVIGNQLAEFAQAFSARNANKFNQLLLLNERAKIALENKDLDQAVSLWTVIHDLCGPYANRRTLAKTSGSSATEEPIAHEASVLIRISEQDFNALLHVAAEAIKHGRYEFAEKVLVEALQGGVPDRDISNKPGRVFLSLSSGYLVTSNHPAYVQAYSSSRPAQTTPPVSVVQPFMKLLEELERQSVPLARVQSVLEAAVLPPDSSSRVQVIADLSDLRNKRVDSLANALVTYAARTETLNKLRSDVESRHQAKPQIDALVVLALIEVKAKNVDRAKQRLSEIDEFCTASRVPPSELSLVAAAAIPAMQISELTSQATSLFDRYTRTLRPGAQTSSGTIMYIVPSQSGSMQYAAPAPQRSSNSTSSAKEPTKLKLRLESLLAIRASQSNVAESRLSSSMDDPREIELINNLMEVSTEALRGGEPDTALEFFARAVDRYVANSSKFSTATFWSELEDRLEKLSPIERYELLANWTLPSSGRSTIRVVADYTNDQTTFDAAVSKTPPCKLVNNLDSLVNAAAAAKRLDELRLRLNRLNANDDPYVATLKLLTSLRKGDQAEVTAIVEQMIRAKEKENAQWKPSATPRSGFRQYSYTLPPDWSYFLAWHALLVDREEDSLRDQYDALRKRMELIPWNFGALTSLSHLERFRALKHRFGSEVEGEKPLQFLHWHNHRRPYYKYFVPPLSDLGNRSALHPLLPGLYQGNEWAQLSLKYPVPEKCSLTYPWPAFNRNCILSLAGVTADITPYEVTLSDIRGRSYDRIITLPKFIQPNDEVVIERDSDKVLLRVNGELIGEQRAFANSPWANVGCNAGSFITNPSIKFEGSLPKDIPLLGSQINEGWVFSSRTLYEIDANGNSRQALTQSSWGIEKGVLASSSWEMHQKSLGVVQFHRDLYDQETVRYEFYYSADKTECHPCLDRTIFLLNPAGVTESWQQNDLSEMTAIASEQTAKQFQSTTSLTFKPDSWNQVEVALANGHLKLMLNGELVYERPWSRSFGSSFGFYKPSSRDAKIQNVILTGTWPEKLPAEVMSDSLRMNREPRRAELALSMELYGDQTLETQVRGIIKLAKHQKPEVAYSMLHDWVLPLSLHRSARCFASRSITDLDQSKHTIELACPAHELVRLAKELNRLDELKSEIQSRTERLGFEHPELMAVRFLIELESGQLAESRSTFEKLFRISQNASFANHTRTEHYPVWIAAWYAAEIPALQSQGVELIYLLNRAYRKATDPSKANSFEPWLIRAQQAITATQNKTPLANSLWHEVTTIRPGNRQGVWSPAWEIQPGVALRHPRPYPTALLFSSPLQGNFSVTAKMPVSETSQPLLNFGLRGLQYDPASQAVQEFRLFDNTKSNVSSLTLPIASNTLVEMRLEVIDEQVKVFVNDMIFEGASEAKAFPWLAIQSSPNSDSTQMIHSVKLSGTPQIPEVVDLFAGNAMRAWMGPKSRNWSFTNGQLEGLGSDSYPADLDISIRQLLELLTYPRPMLEDGTIDLEFYHEANRFTVVVGLGGTVFELLPDGLSARTPTERAELLTTKPLFVPRLNDKAALPLIEKEWNRLSLDLRGDELTFLLNKQKIGSCKLNQSPALRHFSIGFPYQTHSCRVRNVTYRGDWPRELPKVEDQVLATPVTTPLSNDVTSKRLEVIETQTIDMSSSADWDLVLKLTKGQKDDKESIANPKTIEIKAIVDGGLEERVVLSLSPNQSGFVLTSLHHRKFRDLLDSSREVRIPLNKLPNQLRISQRGSYIDTWYISDHSVDETYLGRSLVGTAKIKSLEVTAPEATVELKSTVREPPQ